MRVTIITNEPEVTLWICVPLRVEVPKPGMNTVTVSPDWNPLPKTVTLWSVSLRVGDDGEMDEMLGAG